MSFNLGDFVTRKSYSNDIVFKILKIEGDTVYLKGVDLRLCADAPITDIVKLDNFEGEESIVKGEEKVYCLKCHGGRIRR